MEQKTFFNIFLHIANICCNFIAENNLTNKQFAELINETEEEVNKFFSPYNFTIKQIAKIQSVTNKKIII